MSSLPALLVDQAERRPDEVAYREKEFGIWQADTWQRFLDRVRDFSLGLVKLGLEKGDRVAIVGDNRPEWMIAELATQAVHGISMGVYQDSVAEEVQFLAIYIREAHPVDGWDIGSEHRYYDPQTIEERRQVAGTCEETLQYGIKTYVDEMDDGVMTAYAAWPERLYLIGRDGRVRYAGGLGPFGFKPAELKAAIDALLV